MQTRMVGENGRIHCRLPIEMNKIIGIKQLNPQPNPPYSTKKSPPASGAVAVVSVSRMNEEAADTL